MRLPWWIDEAGNARLDVPVYTDETGWAFINEEVPPVYYATGETEYRLKPYFSQAGHDSRGIVVSEDMGEAVEIRAKTSKLSKARLAGSPALVNLMVDIVALQEPPLIRGAFSHGTRDTQLTRSAASRLRTRQGQYGTARFSGDPLAFARALRDLIQRERIEGGTRKGASMPERELLKRMATEMAFEMAYVLPRPRKVGQDEALDWARFELNRRTGTPIFRKVA